MTFEMSARSAASPGAKKIAEGVLTGADDKSRAEPPIAQIFSVELISKILVSEPFSLRSTVAQRGLAWAASCQRKGVFSKVDQSGVFQVV